MSKRWLLLLLAAFMVVSVFSVTALAEEGTASAAGEEETASPLDIDMGDDPEETPVSSSGTDATTPVPYLLGDVNGDGAVNRADRAYLARYLAGWEGYQIVTKNADVNRDGSINRADRAYLARYLAGWEGYTIS